MANARSKKLPQGRLPGNVTAHVDRSREAGRGGESRTPWDEMVAAAVGKASVPAQSERAMAHRLPAFLAEFTSELACIRPWTATRGLARQMAPPIGELRVPVDFPGTGAFRSRNDLRCTHGETRTMRSKRANEYRVCVEFGFRFPFSHWNTATLIAALIPKGIIGSMILDSALDINAFRAWVGQVLVKELRRGDVVVCDNLPVHKLSGISKLIEAAGAKLIFLPPYSPDLNPMEKAFAQIKSHLRNRAAKTKRKLNLAIESAIDIVMLGNAVSYYTLCGFQGSSTLSVSALR